MSRKQHSDFNQPRCVIYVPGLNTDNEANRIEQFAFEKDLCIVDTIFDKDSGIKQLEYYLESDSMEAVLLRRIEDISSDKREIERVLIMAAKHGISVNCEDAGFEPVTVNFEDDV